MKKLSRQEFDKINTIVQGILVKVELETKQPIPSKYILDALKKQLIRYDSILKQAYNETRIEELGLKLV